MTLALIPQYISDLLLRFDTVVLPGFGAFCLQNVPAEIKGDTIIPPGKVLRFDSSAKNNDGVLANFISEKDKISFFDACARILEYVEKLTGELNAGKEVSLEKIGTLKRSATGEIVFSAFSGTNYGVDSFGLTALHAEPVSKSIENNKKKMETTASTGKRKKIPIAVILIIAVVVFIGAGFAAVYFLKPDLLSKYGIIKKQLVIKMTNPGENKNNAVIDTNKTNQADSSSTNVQQNPGARYYVIAASFRVQANADNYVIQMNNKGNKSESIFMPEKKLYAVSYNVYSERAEAERALEGFKSSGNPAAWILEK